jgi:hypothetical protein
MGGERFVTAIGGDEIVASRGAEIRAAEGRATANSPTWSSRSSAPASW